MLCYWVNKDVLFALTAGLHASAFFVLWNMVAPALLGLGNFVVVVLADAGREPCQNRFRSL